MAEVPGRREGKSAAVVIGSLSRSPDDPPCVAACGPDGNVDGDVGGGGSRRCCSWLSRWRRP